MDYTKNELALIDLISNLNKEFYYFGEEGDLIPSPRWEKERQLTNLFLNLCNQSNQRGTFLMTNYKIYPRSKVEKLLLSL